MVAFGEVASWMKNDFSGMDDTGLARWTYMTFSGQDGRAITLVKHLLLSQNMLSTTPTLFYYPTEKPHLFPAALPQQLNNTIKTWRLEGRRLIVCLDANEHVYTGSIGKSLTLTDKNGLDMVEAVSTTTGKRLSATYF